MANGGLLSAEKLVVSDVVAAEKQHASCSYHHEWHFGFAAAIYLYSTI